MDFKHTEDRSANSNAFMYDSIYFQAPEVYNRLEEEDEDDEEWEDEEDEDFDDEAEDLDDLNSARYGADLDISDDAYDITNPDPDDDHLPEEELQ
ncbi:hypothetical protein [Mucilaginibacter auburnensis]|uniref:Uncharacterized protein n=1 Tax=Mucilaginibacter auburnensis TaxID=1457233 RepID=A0A2H9VNH9_9SPHI|nr:hypothetical protein [Mucilaginibacter auburnensis]PJJ79863.1 hypothetical protein CLV57_3002 [Mucilaginibacter auburnensis]